MSQESIEWLNTQILSGMENTHGKPWWDDSRADRSNHFGGAIPVERVETLFGFDVGRAKVFVHCSDGRVFEAEDFIAMVPDNQDAVYGIHSHKFEGHQYHEWLVNGPAKLVNGSTGISSAGLLKKGAIAWVQVSTPETWKTVQGVEFRSNLLCTTSFDGSIASTYKLTDQLSICDNTREIALGSKGVLYRVKHTKNSQFRLEDAKAALCLLEDNAVAFSAEIATLCEWQVSDAQFQAFMAKLVPLPDKSGFDINARDYSTRTATIAANKRDKLNQLYRADGRVSPWEGTAFGVLQMVNTYNTHLATQRNVDHRALRNMENVITGKLASQDNDALALLAKICERELVCV
jgi:phage/plasmid-like protein (TIGR03299 family)